MLNGALLLAQTDLAKAVQTAPFSDNTREKLVLFTALLLITSLALVLVFVMHKRRPSGRFRHHPSREPAQPISREPGSEAFPGGRRQRRRRREHRRRNPTLAETGGLPPRRQDDDTRTPPQT